MDDLELKRLKSGQSKLVAPRGLDTTDKINRHVLTEIDRGIRRWIALSVDNKQKALMRTIDVKDEQITHLKVTESLLHEFVEEATKCLTLIRRNGCWCDHSSNKFVDCKCQPVKDFMAELSSVPRPEKPVEPEEDLSS